MAPVTFTPKLRRVTTTGPSTLGETMEFRGYRSLRLRLRVVLFEGASSPVLWLAMETSAQVDRDFASLGRFDPIAVNDGVAARNYDYIMRYVRWTVVQLDGADAALFTLNGVASQ